MITIKSPKKHFKWFRTSSETQELLKDLGINEAEAFQSTDDDNTHKIDIRLSNAYKTYEFHIKAYFPSAATIKRKVQNFLIESVACINKIGNYKGHHTTQWNYLLTTFYTINELPRYMRTHNVAQEKEEAVVSSLPAFEKFRQVSRDSAQVGFKCVFLRKGYYSIDIYIRTYDPISDYFK
jgi:hypothetical protein